MSSLGTPKKAQTASTNEASPLLSPAKLSQATPTRVNKFPATLEASITDTRPRSEAGESSTLWLDIGIIAGCAGIASLCGSVYSFNVYSDALQANLSLSEVFVSTMAGVGLVGVYFTLLAGLANDHYGPRKTSAVSIVISALGYLLMSYAESKGVLLLGFCIAGFGCGGAFLSVLSLSITLSPTGGGWGVGVVSCAMSLSIAFGIKILQAYASVTGCHANRCWRQYTRFLAVAAIVVQSISWFGLLLFKKENYAHLQEGRGRAESVFVLEEEGRRRAKSEAGEDEEIHTVLIYASEPMKTTVPPIIETPKNVNAALHAMSFVESLSILKQVFFWVLWAAYFAGIASAIFVITHTSAMWDEYASGKALHSAWAINILVVFSVCNAIGNVSVGVVSDRLAAAKILAHRHFVGIVLIVFAVVFGVLGIGFATHSFNEYFVLILLASVGFGFGTYLVLVPVIVAESYGPLNFGKTFSYIQLASSAASLITPVAGTVFVQATGSYAPVHFTFAGLMAVTGMALLIVKLPE